ncbi:hypothetical protein [Brevibacillus sp. 179-C9.3 HS]|uniref:hypothetical protein n=1 Tax=unclassified Brevibacillus TaxID=2684853 RepID=UPI0039A2BF79
MSTIQKPIIVGDYLNGEAFAWAYWLEHHCRVAVIGDNQVTQKNAFLTELARTCSLRDDSSVYWITGETKSNQSATMMFDSIPWVEGFSDPPEFFEDRHIFMEIRSFFTSSFVQLLARRQGINRSSLPGLVYREHMEGPLVGLRREVEKQGVQWLLSEINHLEQVAWSQEKGICKYHVLREASLIDTALSFLRGIWSLWSHTARLETPQQLLVIIEPPKELLWKNSDPLITNITVEALRIVNYLSEVTTTSFVLSSEILFPVPEQKFRYVIYLPTKDSDIDLTAQENKKQIAAPVLFEEWDRKSGSVCLWEDRYTAERHIVRLRTENMDFLDGF